MKFTKKKRIDEFKIRTCYQENGPKNNEIKCKKITGIYPSKQTRARVQTHTHTQRE